MGEGAINNKQVVILSNTFSGYRKICHAKLYVFVVKLGELPFQRNKKIENVWSILLRRARPLLYCKCNEILGFNFVVYKYTRYAKMF